MKTRTFIGPFGYRAALTSILLMFFTTVLPLSADVAALSLSEQAVQMTEAALARNSELQAAAIQLRSAAAGLSASSPWRSASVQLQGSLRDSFGSASEAPAASSGMESSWSASAVLPLVSWLSLAAGINGGTPEDLKGSLSVTIQPFSTTNTNADLAYRSALVQYRSVLRSALLSVNQNIRELLVLEAELGYRQAELTAAESEYESVLVKSAAGQLMQADVLNAIASLGSAELAYEEFFSTYLESRAVIARSLSMEVQDLPDLEELEQMDAFFEQRALGTAMDAEQWLEYSSQYQKSLVDAESAVQQAAASKPRPDLSIKGDLSSSVSDNSTGSWSLSATFKIPVDSFYRDAYKAYQDTAVKKKDNAEKSRIDVLSEFERKKAELSRLERSLERYETALHAAGLLFEQVELLYSMGQTSQAALHKAEAELLRTLWQQERTRQSYRNALDELSLILSD